MKNNKGGRKGGKGRENERELRVRSHSCDTGSCGKQQTLNTAIEVPEFFKPPAPRTGFPGNMKRTRASSDLLSMLSPPSPPPANLPIAVEVGKHQPPLFKRQFVRTDSPEAPPSPDPASPPVASPFFCSASHLPLVHKSPTRSLRRCRPLPRRPAAAMRTASAISSPEPDRAEVLSSLLNDLNVSTPRAPSDSSPRSVVSSALSTAPREDMSEDWCQPLDPSACHPLPCGSNVAAAAVLRRISLIDTKFHADWIFGYSPVHGSKPYPKDSCPRSTLNTCGA